MACTYQSITLQPGEVFILPPNATLVGATNTAQLSSENNCLNTTQLEDFLCYGVMYADSNDCAGVDPPTPVYEDVLIAGITVNNVDYPFVDLLDTSSSEAQILASLNQTPFANLFTNITAVLNPNNLRGNVLAIAFKTLPSIASHMYFYGSASGEVAAPTSPSIRVSFPVLPYDEFIAQGGTKEYPVCTT